MELRGNLRDFSLPDVVQLLGFGQKTGALRVDGSQGGATLFFEKGVVVHAQYLDVEAEQAVYGLIGVTDGDFCFEREVEPPQRTISIDTTNLLMEAARLLDESRREDSPSSGATAECACESGTPLPAGVGQLDDSCREAAAGAEAEGAQQKPFASERGFSDESSWELAPSEDPAGEQADSEPAEATEAIRDPREIKRLIRALIDGRFGRKAKRLGQAVDRCGDSADELLDLAGRIENYVHAFLDKGASKSLGQELRGLIAGPSAGA